ncbi:hypothetical protein WJX81_004695 [Elliptochloris bilobata]|uniref:FGFR1 oncogene partner (FOP) N-terminal dimerisation domain-containing protein n=1 Tax=Elliptochloris bilobata TaxID=381761 RepID=A0AAW1RN86_9CHLO
MDEVKQVVSASLEKEGLLSSLRAELRACVFAALDEQEVSVNGCGLAQRVFNPKRAELMATDEGALLAALIKDFLVTTRLAFTLKVYEPEVRLGDDDISREQLAGILGLDAGGGEPLLLAVLQAHLHAYASQENGAEAGEEAQKVSAHGAGASCGVHASGAQPEAHALALRGGGSQAQEGAARPRCIGDELLTYSKEAKSSISAKDNNGGSDPSTNDP